MPEHELVTYLGNEPIGFIFDGTTLWGTITHISLLYGTGIENVRQHINNICAENELKKSTTSKKILGVVEKRPNLQTWVYNLDVVSNMASRFKTVKDIRAFLTKGGRENAKSDFMKILKKECRLLTKKHKAVILCFSMWGIKKNRLLVKRFVQ